MAKPVSRSILMQKFEFNSLSTFGITIPIFRSLVHPIQSRIPFRINPLLFLRFYPIALGERAWVKKRGLFADSDTEAPDFFRTGRGCRDRLR